jgi:hypothetical protein
MPLRDTQLQETTPSRKLCCLLLISDAREYGLVRSTHTRKLSSAHVPSHYNRDLPDCQIIQRHSSA